MKRLLVVADYQNDFVNGALGFDAAQKLEEGISAKITEVLNDDGYVIFTKDTHMDNYLQTREGKFLPIKHCIKGSEGHLLYGSLSKYEENADDRTSIVEKGTFGSNILPKRVLELIGSEPDSIEICGVVTNICVICNAIVLHTAFPTSDITIYANLCAAAGESHQKALDIMNGLGMKIIG